MSIKNLELAVTYINGKMDTEASGNIDLENVVEYAETGVNYISMGAITHSAAVVDLSLRAI